MVAFLALTVTHCLCSRPNSDEEIQCKLRIGIFMKCVTAAKPAAF